MLPGCGCEWCWCYPLRMRRVEIQISRRGHPIRASSKRLPNQHSTAPATLADHTDLRRRSTLYTTRHSTPIGAAIQALTSARDDGTYLMMLGPIHLFAISTLHDTARFFAHARQVAAPAHLRAESARRCFWPALEAPTTPATRILYRAHRRRLSVYRGCRERTRGRSDNAQLPPPPVETSRDGRAPSSRAD